MNHSSPPRPGDRIGDRYTLESELGRGTFGIVYRGRDVGTGDEVAIKILSPEATRYEGVEERFVREARLASALQSPHAVHIYGFGTHRPGAAAGGLSFIVMELLDGLTLAQWLSACGRMSAEEVGAVLLESLHCLAEAHEHGIIHRDLKPANLFVQRRADGSTRMKVLDFGVAKAVQGQWGKRTMAQVTAAGDVLGTPAFMAPEQGRGELSLTAAVDVYAMGCVAWTLLAGALPYQARTSPMMVVMHMGSPIPDVPGYDNAHPLVAAIRQAMAKEAVERFDTARPFGQAVWRALHTAGLSPRMPLWPAHLVAVDHAAAEAQQPTQLHLADTPTEGLADDPDSTWPEVTRGSEDSPEDAPSHVHATRALAGPTLFLSQARLQQERKQTRAMTVPPRHRNDDPSES